jgi:hypothetical protein
MERGPDCLLESVGSCWGLGKHVAEMWCLRVNRCRPLTRPGHLLVSVLKQLLVNFSSVTNLMYRLCLEIGCYQVTQEMT